MLVITFTLKVNLVNILFGYFERASSLASEMAILIA